MKLFKSLLVAPATIGLLAPFSTFAGEADLNNISNKYTKVNENTSNTYARKETTGIFGNKDNRLGGSKTAYKTNYKPQDPNPKFGPVNYDILTSLGKVQVVERLKNI